MDGQPTTTPNPLEEALNAKVACAIEQSRDQGLILSLLERASACQDGAKRIEVELKPTIPPADEWEAPVGWRNHTIEDAASFIAYAKKYGDPGKSLIFYNNEHLVISLDEMRERGERELVSLNFALHTEFKEWHALVNNPQGADHRSLVKFLILHAHNMTTPALLESMRSVKASAEVKFDSDIQTFDQAQGVMFKATGGDELRKFPREMSVLVPILDGDDIRAEQQQFRLRIEIVMPEQHGEGIRFLLVCPQWDALVKQRIDRELSIIREALGEGWTICRGTHDELGREIGNRPVTVLTGAAAQRKGSPNVPGANNHPANQFR